MRSSGDLRGISRQSDPGKRVSYDCPGLRLFCVEAGGQIRLINVLESLAVAHCKVHQRRLGRNECWRGYTARP